MYLLVRIMEKKLSSKVNLLTAKEVAGTLRVSVRTVWRLVSGRTFPKPVSVGRCKRWKLSEIERYLDGLTV